jgi:uracil-DNA glycosylase family protein
MATPEPLVHPAVAALAESRSFRHLAEAALDCTACDLYRHATQTVFGAGLRKAELLLVGEQPGDEEDKQGEPFVGPAGRLLDRALDEAGIDRAQAYVTNAVKHFKWKPAGWRRLHQKPNSREVAACRPWLEAEMALIEPRLVVGLGATACQAMLGPQVRVSRQRGEVEQWMGVPVLITVHPSSILRSSDEESRQQAMESFVEDLSKAAAFLTG